MAYPNRSGHMAVGASYHPPPWTCPSCSRPARTYTCPSCAPPAPAPARAYGGYPPARARAYGYPPARGNPPARAYRYPPARGNPPARAYRYPPARGNPPARAYGGYGGYGGNQPARGYGGDVAAGLAIGAVGAAGIMSGDGWYPPVPAYGGGQNITGLVATGIEELAAFFDNLFG